MASLPDRLSLKYQPIAIVFEASFAVYILMTMRSVWLLPFVSTITVLAQPESVAIPFDDWLSSPSDFHIHWSLTVDQPMLTNFQHIETSVGASIDATEAAKLDATGQLRFVFQIRDREHHIYRFSRPFTRATGSDPAHPALTATKDLCVRPGEYQVAAIVYDERTKEHSLRRTNLRVAPLSKDPLPAMWNAIPRIESEDGCYNSTLALPLKSKTTVGIDLIVNTPVDARTGIGARLMVVSELQLSNGSATATTVDLKNRKAITQEVTRPLDPNSFLGPLPEGSQYMVDAAAFSIDPEGTEFFHSQVLRLLRPNHVLIILSDRKSVHKDEHLPLIQATSVPSTRIYYIRCNPAPFDWLMHLDNRYGEGRGETVVIPTRPNSWGVNGTVFIPTPPPPAPRPDSLARTLDPLHPRLFDVTTALEFRRALAEIMTETAPKQ
jgi:hypothetical protein